MTRLLAMCLVACGPTPEASELSVQSYVQERYSEPSAPLDLLLVVDSEATLDDQSRDALVRGAFLPGVDKRFAVTTTDISGCDGLALDGRCGRLLAMGGQTFVTPRDLGSEGFRAVLSAALDTAKNATSSPTTGAQAALLAAGGLGDLLRPGSALGVAIIVPPSITHSDGTTAERLHTATGHRAFVETMDRWRETVIDRSACVDLPAPPERNSSANLHVKLGPPGALTEVRQATDPTDTEGWFYDNTDRVPLVCLVGTTLAEWLNADRILRIQVITETGDRHH